MHPSQEITIIIERLGGLGDGVGTWQGMPVFVAHTLPGEQVLAVVESVAKDHARARLHEVLTPCPTRLAAPCAHFGSCGGCALQHLPANTYRDFKRATLVSTLARLGYGTECVTDLIEAGPGARRRAEFTVRVAKGVVGIGFLRPRSHELVDIAACPVSSDAILALLPAFRHCVASLKKPGHVESIAIADLGHGLDVMLSLKERATGGDREKLIAFAGDPRILRFSARSSAGIERLRQNGEVRIRLGAVEVELPIGAFQQATVLGQTAITERVLKHCHGFKRVADIYSGIGTYAFPLVEAGHQVEAYEGSVEMTTTLHNAARRANLENKVSATARDLFRQPLNVSELARFDAVVINPPRNGALPQFQSLAKSGVTRIVVVSCNPATFERDAIPLRDVGYRLLEATPIDQFTWSPHLELVAAFEKS